MKVNLPAALKKYFWGDNIDSIKWPNHKKYVVQTLLERGNSSAIKWLFDYVGKVQVEKMLPELRLSKKSLNFWRMYLS